MAAWPQSSLILHNRRLEEIKSIPKWESGNQIAAEVVIPQKHLKSEIESLVNQKKGVDKSLAAGVCFLVSYNVMFEIVLTWGTVRINKRSLAEFLTRTCRSHVLRVLLHNRTDPIHYMDVCWLKFYPLFEIISHLFTISTKLKSKIQPIK